MTLGFENQIDNESEKIVTPMKINEQFDDDTAVVAEQAELFVKKVTTKYIHLYFCFLT